MDSLSSIRVFVVVLFCLVMFPSSSSLREDEMRYQLRPEERNGHFIHKRFVTIYSKPHGEESEKQTGRKMSHHLKNLLGGGSIGVDVDFAPIKKLFYKIKDAIAAKKQARNDPDWTPGFGILDPRKKGGYEKESSRYSDI